jgi:hypothetical protein
MKRPVEKKKDELKYSRIVSQKEWEAVREQLVVKGEGVNTREK